MGATRKAGLCAEVWSWRVLQVFGVEMIRKLMEEGSSPSTASAGVSEAPFATDSSDAIVMFSWTFCCHKVILFGCKCR